MADNSEFLNWHASLSPEQKAAFAQHVQQSQQPQSPVSTQPVATSPAAPDLSAQNNTQKIALLQAIADQGSAGRAAFAQAQQQNDTSKATAMQEALNRAGQVNAPDAFVQNAQAYTAAPFDQNAQSLSNQGATFNADIARQTARDSSYMDKVGAVIPIVQSQAQASMAQIRSTSDQNDKQRQDALTSALQQRIAVQQAQQFQQQQADAAAKRAEEEHQWAQEQHQWEQQDAQSGRDFNLQDRQLQLQIAQQELARAGASGGGGGGSYYSGQGNPLAELIRGLGGADTAKATLLPTINSAVDAGVHSNFDPIGAALATSPGGPNAGQSFEQVLAGFKGQLLDSLGSQLGLGPGQLHAFLGNDSPAYVAPKKDSAKDMSMQQQEQLRQSPTYQGRLPTIVDRLRALTTDKKNPMSVGNAKKSMIGDIRDTTKNPDYKVHPQEYELLINDILTA